MDSRQIKPVLSGAFLGTLCVLFGISWAIYLVLNHDGIHERLEQGMKARRAATAPALVEKPASNAHPHADGAVHEHAAQPKAHNEEDPSQEAHGHNAPLEGKDNDDGHKHHSGNLPEEAHKRLARGHAHWMGLGILSICLSLMLAFLDAPARVKTLGSAVIGIGALIYPVSWIYMGFKTTALGIEASQEAALPFVAFSVPFVLFGLIICLYYLIRQTFR
jgi:hypothetical protein